MAYLFKPAYRRGKLGLSALAGTVGVVGLGVGIVTGGTGTIILGSFVVIESCVLAVDNYKSGKDLRNYVKEQQSAWKEQKSQLDHIVLEYKKEHDEFLKAVSENGNQLEKMKTMQGRMEFERESERAQYEDQIQSLKKRLERLSELEENYMRENARLSTYVREASIQVSELTDENEHLRAIETELKNQVNKLKDLHEQSKQLLKNLVLAGDTFTGFETKFGRATDHLQNASSKVEQKVDDLQETLLLLKEVAEELHGEHVRSLLSAEFDPSTLNNNEEPPQEEKEEEKEKELVTEFACNDADGAHSKSKQWVI